MKLFIKVIVLALMLALIGPFYLRAPDGRPLLTFQDIKPDFMVSLSGWWRDISKEAGKTVGNEHFGETRVYKWKDAEGVWQMSDSPPVDETEYETVWVDPDANLIKGLSPEELELTLEGDPNSAPSPTPAVDIPLPLTVSPEQLNKLLDDVKDVQSLMDQRATDLGKL